jgi:Tol biopolymer transport system component
VIVSQLDPRAGVSALWLLDTSSGVRNRFTLESGDETDGAWSPDGSSIVYGTGSGTDTMLVQKSVNGSGIPEQFMAHKQENILVLDWSTDGKFVLFASNEVGKEPTISACPMFGPPGDRVPRFITKGSSTRTGARFSPDGRWVAYHLEESGVMEVFVVPFPGPGGRIQVSTQGGSEPVWRRDGRELFYFAPDNRLMAVQVSTQDSTFTMNGVTPLFQASDAGTGYRYDVAGDGQRFLVRVEVPDASTSAINLTLNWTADLKKR